MLMSYIASHAQIIHNWLFSISRCWGVCQIDLILQCPVLKYVSYYFSVWHRRPTLTISDLGISVAWKWILFPSLSACMRTVRASFICCLMLTRLWGVGLWLSWDTICHSNVLWLISSFHSWFFLSVSDDFIRFGHALSIKTPYGHVKTECRATPSLFCSAKIYPSPDIISGFSQDMDHLGSVGDLIYNSY